MQALAVAAIHLLESSYESREFQAVARFELERTARQSIPVRAAGGIAEGEHDYVPGLFRRQAQCPGGEGWFDAPQLLTETPVATPQVDDSDALGIEPLAAGLVERAGGQLGDLGIAIVAVDQ